LTVSAVSTFGKIRDVLHTIALIGGLSYAGYTFFKVSFSSFVYFIP